MKPPWQARPQNQQYLQSRNDDHLQRPANIRHQPPPSLSNTPLVMPQMYVSSHTSHVSLPPHYLASMIPKVTDQTYVFDPHSSSPIHTGGIPRPQMSPMPTVQQSQHPSSAFQSRRVSLLRDIGIAGERDRDIIGTLSDASGASLSYAVNPSMRRMSLPASQGNNPRPVERPVTTLPSSNQPFSTYTPTHTHLKDHAGHSRHSISGPHQHLQHGMVTPKPHQDIKKEPPYRVDATGKVVHSPIHRSDTPPSQPIAAQVVRQSSVSSVKSDSAIPQSMMEQKSKKEELAQAMQKLDREISKVEDEIGRLEKKKDTLESSASKPPQPGKSESFPQRVEPKPRDLWQVIYAENKKKAESARAVLDGLCKRYEMPLYNQPSDTDVFKENIAKNEEMRPKLLGFFKKRIKLQNIRQRYMCARYDQLSEEWKSKTEEEEENPKKKAKEAKTREFFEKLFPEVRKQREQQERIDRVGTRGDTCRSEADLAEIVDGLNEQENQLQHMKQLTVIPPMLLDEEERRIKFINTNGFIREPFKEFRESQKLDAWSDQEKAIFKEKYVQHPKNFNLISSFIEKKSVADCILYYYLTKKTVGYKAIVRKQTLKPKKLKSGRTHASHNQDQSSNKDSGEKGDKDDKKDVDNDDEKESIIDKPPSPRMTRARKQIMNWTEEEISLVKEGFSKHGRDFSSISRMVTNKTEIQVRRFYNNYKKKHGLDQLITESKRKKPSESRRTRHHAQSPDNVAMVTEEEDRKTTDSPLADDKVKQQDKTDESTVSKLENKKEKLKERTPSPAVSVGKSESAESSSSSSVTTHIRTRRTAALAAATQHDLNEKESSKRPNSSKSPALAPGEPVEKKAKKTDRKSKKDKTPTENKETINQEAVKEEEIKLEDKPGAQVTDKPVTDKDKNIVNSEENDPQTTPKPPAQPHQVVADKQAVGSMSDDATMIRSDQAVDGDSSATCSADEGATSDQGNWKSRSKPHIPSTSVQDTFDYDFNDSPVISLYGARQSSASTVGISSITATSTIQQSAGVTVVDVATPENPRPPVLQPINPDRPQSLPPPGVAVQPNPSQTREVASNASKFALHVPPVSNNSRPSSTPAPADTTRFQSSVKLPQGGATQQTGVLPMHIPPSQPILVSDIRNLTYQAGKTSTHLPTTVPKKVTSVVDPVMDLTIQKTTQVKTEAPANAPSYYQPPPPSLSVASSLQKDFQSLTNLPSHKHSIPTISSSYQRVYSSKEVQSMVSRAADIPVPVPVPVSSLRFDMARPGGSGHQNRPNPPNTAIKNILDLKPDDIIKAGKDDKIPPSLAPILQPHLTHPQRSHLKDNDVTPRHPSDATSKTSMDVRLHPTSHLVSIKSGRPVDKSLLLDPNEVRDKIPPPHKPPTSQAMRTPASQVMQIPDLTKQRQEAINPGKSLPSYLFPGGPYHPAMLPTIPHHLLLNHPIKLENPLDPSSRSQTPEHGLPPGFSIPQLRPPYRMSGSDPRLGDLPKRKMSDDQSPTNKASSIHFGQQRSSTPPQGRPQDRKQSRGQSKGQAEVMGSRVVAPMATTTTDKQQREELKRPDSVSHPSMEKRGNSESHLMPSQRSLSSQSLSSASSRNLPEVRPENQIYQAASSFEPLQALAKAAALSFPSNMLSYQQQPDMNTVVQQYLSSNQQLLAQSILHPSQFRNFSPTGGSESIDRTRQNLLLNDYTTALKIQQQQQNVFSTGSSFAGGTPVISVPDQPQLTLPTHHILLHPGSPSTDPTNFIPTHPPNLPSPLSVNPVSRGPNPSRNTPSRSPSSPHRSSTPHFNTKSPYPGPGPQHIPLMPDMFHPALEKRRSSSPRRTPSSDHHTPNPQSTLATQIASHELRRTPPVLYSTPPPRSAPVLKGYPYPGDRLQVSPLGLQRSHSPHVQGVRGLNESPHDTRELPRDSIQPSELHSSQGGSRLNKSNHSEREQSPRSSQQDQRRKENVDQSESSRHHDSSKTSSQQPKQQENQQNKIMIQLAMTPASFISAIIDHNINQEYEMSSLTNQNRSQEGQQASHHQRQSSADQSNFDRSSSSQESSQRPPPWGTESRPAKPQSRPQQPHHEPPRPQQPHHEPPRPQQSHHDPPRPQQPHHEPPRPQQLHHEPPRPQQPHHDPPRPQQPHHDPPQPQKSHHEPSRPQKPHHDHSRPRQAHHEPQRPQQPHHDPSRPQQVAPHILHQAFLDSKVSREYSDGIIEQQMRTSAEKKAETSSVQEINMRRENAIRESTRRENAIRESTMRENTMRENAIRESTMRENTMRENTEPPKKTMQAQSVGRSTSVVQHPLTPGFHGPLETIIRTALGQGTSQSPVPAEASERSPRSDQVPPGSNSPGIHSPTSRNKPAEVKRNDTSSYSTAPPPVYISALAFRAGQNPASKQPVGGAAHPTIPPTAPIPPRPSVVAGSTSGAPVSHLMGPGGVYHPPPPQVTPSTPKASMTSAYEPLSDSD